MASSSEPLKRPTPKCILDLTNDERKRFLNSFDTVFSDCDGVLWQTMQQSIPGAGEAVDYLRGAGKKVVFVTNNSLRPIEDQIKKFLESGVSVVEDDIYHPVRCIIEYLKELKFEGLIYCIATTPFKDSLRNAGFQVADGPDRLLEETFQDLAANVFVRLPIKAVIIDVDYNMSVAKLMRAHMYLKDPECRFIGGAADTIIPFGIADIIGPGPFITVAEICSKRKAAILGKPGKELCEMLKARSGLKDPSRGIFIGDSLGSDIGFGKQCGFQTLAVLSGQAKLEHLSDPELPIEEVPDFYANSIADFIDFIK